MLNLEIETERDEGVLGEEKYQAKGTIKRRERSD